MTNRQRILSQLNKLKFNRTAFLCWIGYLIWILFFRLLFLTLLTFSMQHSGSTPSFGEITEANSSNTITLMGMASLLFLFFLFILRPMIQINRREIITLNRLKHHFLPGFFHGSVVAFGLIAIFMMSGMVRYLGVSIQADEASLAVSTIGIRILVLLLLIYCEEFIFRERLAKLTEQTSLFVNFTLTAFAFCILKIIQFDLSIIQLITLFLISFKLSLKRELKHDFAQGAGFLAALLIIFQPLFGLPILGTEFSGVILLKPIVASPFVRWVSGGRGGPLSSVALQFILLLDIGRSFQIVRQAEKLT